VEELTGRGLVDVLGGRDKLRAGLADLQGHEGVVDTVAGETVDLRDYDVVDRVGVQPLQHALEVGAVGGTG
jgi:hypothetical protein